MSRAIVSLLVLLALVVARPAPCGAQGAADESDAKPATAKAFNDEGVRLLEQGRFEEALAQFEEAFRLDPSEDYILNIAIAYANMESYQEALDHCDRFLARSTDPVVRERVQKFRARMEAKLAAVRGRIDVRTTPDGVFVSIGKRRRVAPSGQVDGQPGSGEALFKAPFTRWLEPGPHRLFFELEGYTPKNRVVDVAVGQTTVVEVELVPAPRTARLTVDADVDVARVFVGERLIGLTPLRDAEVEPGTVALRVEATGRTPYRETLKLVAGEHRAVLADLAPLPTPPKQPPVPEELPEPTPDRSGQLATWGWITLGAGVACLAGGGALNGLASSRADDVGGIDTDQPQSAIRSEYGSIESDVDGLMAGAVSLYVIGGAAVATGTTLLILEALDGDDEGGSATVTPVALPGGAGLSATLTF